MRALVPLLLLLCACSAEKAPRAAPTGVFASGTRDRLCIGESQRAGVISYANESDANCSLSGRLDAAGDKWALVPSGEGACRLTLDISGDRATITNVPGACSYYCAGGASLAGRRFTRAAGVKATDLGGEPLC